MEINVRKNNSKIKQMDLKIHQFIDNPCRVKYGVGFYLVRRFIKFEAV